MSLSAWEQDALDSIKNGLADADPALVARLAMFTRLASGEDMPVREKIQAVKQQVARRRRRMYQRLGVGRGMVLVWLVTTLTLITAALASSRGDGPRSCAASFATLCGATAAPQPTQPAQPIP
jgi:hypothetical protein